MIWVSHIISPAGAVSIRQVLAHHHGPRLKEGTGFRLQGLEYSNQEDDRSDHRCRIRLPPRQMINETGQEPYHAGEGFLTSILIDQRLCRQTKSYSWA